MAARLSKTVDERTRLKIQTTQLVNRLTNHALNDVEMSSTQIRAIEILLKKSLPDLQSIEHSTDPDKPLSLKWSFEVVSANSDDTRETSPIPDNT